MKKLLFLLASFIISLQINAQKITDRPHVVTASDGTPVTLYGCVIASDNSSWSKPGIYSFPSDKGYPFTSVAADVNVYGGGTIAGDEYFAIYYWEEGNLIQLPVTLTVYDVNTWKVNRAYSCSAITGIATDLAYDHHTQNIYGCFMNFDYSATQTFGRLEFDDKEKTYSSVEIAQFPERMMALTVAEDGTLYSIGSSGKLYTVNKTTGSVTVVGDTKTNTAQWGWQSACYDKATGKIFWSGNNDMYDQCLFEVDPSNAKTTMIANYSDHSYEQVIGMFIKQKFAEVKIPEKVANFGVEFNKSDLTGNLSFIMPDKYTDGSAITGGLSYKILLNGKEHITKACKPGETITQTVTVPTDDIYTIMVSAVADNVESEGSHLTTYIGNDTPNGVVSVLASLSENADGGYDVNLSWDESEGSVHGGYMDLSALGYTVVRYPGNVKVAENLKSTTFTDKMSKDYNGQFFYEVTVVCNGKVSEGTKSNSLKIGGNVKFPYNETFDTADSFNNFTVIDANNDGSTWQYGDGNVIYTYNSKNAADDYLVLPVMALRADRYYVLKFNASNTYPVEKVAAYVGTDGTAAALTECIVEPTEVTYRKTAELSGTFTPKADGRYYFAIKAVSDADRSSLYVDNITIEEKSANGPKAVTNLIAKAGEKGALNATVSFTTPTECMDGTPLTSIKSVRIKCDDNVIKEFKDVQKGTSYTFEHTEGVFEGLRKYSVEVSNENGYGKKAETSVYIGIDIPGKVLNLWASEDPDEEGTVILTWDAPAIGQHGGYVDPAGLTYIISKGAASHDIDNGNSTTYRDKLDVSGGRQVFEGYNVYADNDKGSGRNVWQTIVTVAGPSVIAPMNESLSGMHMKDPWVATMLVGEIGEASWIPVDGSGVKSDSQDRDGGLWIYKSLAANKQCRIESPKIDIRELSSPNVSFWLYSNSKDASVEVTVSSEFGQYKSLGTVVPVFGEGWQRFNFNLKEFSSSRFIRIGFTGCSMEGGDQLISLDNITVSEDIQNNLKVCDLVSPKRTAVGEKSVFDFAVRNTGNDVIKADDYMLELYKNDKLVTSEKGVDMPAGAYVKYSLTDIPTVSDKENNTYYIYVNYPADEMTEDNKTQEVTIALEYPSYPVVSSLKAQLDGGAVSLTWNAPDLSNISGTPTTESFETYEMFSIDNVGEWTLYDGDKCKTILISLGAEPLDYPHAGKEMSFQVFNSLHAGIPFASWTPKTGDQMIAAMKAVGNSNDDWIISPELNAKAQTISFYAKTGMNSPYIPELLEVLYSTTDKEISSFKQIDATLELDNVKEWNYYKFDLPEGAKYFALRCVSNDKFALLIDDITYIAKDAKEENLSLIGYNVYRDDVKLNAEPVLDITYIDGQLEYDKNYTYNVTAIYDKGESRYSEPCVVNTTGINEVIAQNAEVKAVNGGISINVAGPVSVYDVTGAKVYSGECMGSMTISLQQGSYIVNVNGKAHKISVR